MNHTKPPALQAEQMIECGGTYPDAIRLAEANIKLYAKYSPTSSVWWSNVRKELLTMKKNHCQSEHAYYQAITGE